MLGFSWIYGRISFESRSLLNSMSDKSFADEVSYLESILVTRYKLCTQLHMNQFLSIVKKLFSHHTYKIVCDVAKYSFDIIDMVDSLKYVLNKINDKTIIKVITTKNLTGQMRSLVEREMSSICLDYDIKYINDSKIIGGCIIEVNDIYHFDFSYRQMLNNFTSHVRQRLERY